jgi:hypothetical protein
MAALEEYGGVKVVAIAPGFVFVNTTCSGTLQLITDIDSSKRHYGQIIQKRWSSLAIRSKTQ